MSSWLYAADGGRCGSVVGEEAEECIKQQDAINNYQRYVQMNRYNFILI